MKAGMGPKLHQGLKQGLSQSLVMTPQLVQAIKLLQMSHLELSKHIETELQENPFLEQTDQNAPEGADQIDQSGQVNELRDQTHYEVDGTEGSPVELTRANDTIQTPPDADFSNLYQDEIGIGAQPEVRPTHDAARQITSVSNSAPQTNMGNPDGDSLSLDARFANEPSLVDHLERQIDLLTEDPVMRALSHYLAAQLDGAGYLQIDSQDLISLFSVTEDIIDQAIALLQSCEPAGIGARSLRECLSLQLADRQQLDEAMTTLLDHLDVLGSGDLAKLAHICALDETALLEKITLIKGLNPKPGEQFTGPEPESLIADVIVTPRLKAAHADYGFHHSADPEDEDIWHIELNSQVLPKLLVNERYFKTVSRSASAEEKEFLNGALQSASGLVKALDQRARSILKVAGEIVKQQSAFMEEGLMALKPMTLRQVAEAVELHESTVSRVTANKYIATPRGTFEMKFFFSSSIAGTDGETFSGEAVRYRIKQLIDQETPDAILSDDALVEKLRRDGITIARRTIAKYRENLGFGSSAARRRQKRAQRPV